ncbi:MAG: calcium-binding protein [Roseococcus sp.]
MGLIKVSMANSAASARLGGPLDHLTDRFLIDPVLRGNQDGDDLIAAATASYTLNGLIGGAARATGADADGVFTVAELQAMNAWLQADPARIQAFAEAYGADAYGRETGFHIVVGDGGSARLRGLDLIDDVMEGIYSLGLTLDGTRGGSDGPAPGAELADVASWLTLVWQDNSTSGTGLDRLTDLISADGGLAKLADARFLAGVQSSDGLVRLLLDGLTATGALSDGRVSSADVLSLNAWIRAEPARLSSFTALHGSETGGGRGFHLLEGDGGTDWLFGERLVDVIADGIFHAGFRVQGGNLQDQTGRADVSVVNLATWLDYFLADLSTTGTGLDRITDAIMTDRGLNTWTRAADIIAGATAANGLNQLIAEGIAATGIAADGWFTDQDVVTLNAWIRADPTRYARFLDLHGNDENGVETAFHKVQGDGGRTEIFGERLIDTVADGIYHIGFEIADGRLLNEDGNANASLWDVAAWLNGLYLGNRILQGEDGADLIQGDNRAEHLRGEGSNDILRASGGNDILEGGWGEDLLEGGAGNDLLLGGNGWDSLDGGQNGDTYRVSGNESDGFEDYDLYRDPGTSGADGRHAHRLWQRQCRG